MSLRMHFQAWRALLRISANGCRLTSVSTLRMMTSSASCRRCASMVASLLIALSSSHYGTSCRASPRNHNRLSGSAKACSIVCMMRRCMTKGMSTGQTSLACKLLCCVPMRAFTRTRATTASLSLRVVIVARRLALPLVRAGHSSVEASVEVAEVDLEVTPPPSALLATTKPSGR